MLSLRSLLVVTAVAAAALTDLATAEAHPFRRANHRAETYDWNRNYAHTNYGQPVAMVVPPTANLQTNWGWGVGSSRISRMDHQFGRNYPGIGSMGGPYQNTPAWPQDTNQFGVYHVRGPW